MMWMLCNNVILWIRYLWKFVIVYFEKKKYFINIFKFELYCKLINIEFEVL